jgi:shikimate 5-dehydrogenase
MSDSPQRNNRFLKTLYLILCILTAMVGYTIHHNVGYAVLNFIFAPISIAYWLVTHQINISVLRETFSFFLK